MERDEAKPQHTVKPKQSLVRRLVAQPTAKQASFDLDRRRLNLVLLHKEMVLVSSATNQRPVIERHIFSISFANNPNLTFGQQSPDS